MAVLGFHHVAISTPDIARLSAFYCDLFGFERVFDMAWEQGADDIDRMMAVHGTAAKVVMLRTGNSFIEMFEFASPTPKPVSGDRPVIDHGITHLCIAVDDAEVECARLEALGLRLHCPPLGGAPVNGTYGRDPDGNVIEILEVSADDHALAFVNRRLAALQAAHA